MARVRQCDFCKRYENPFGFEERIVIHEHMIKRKDKVVIPHIIWDELDICEDCLKKFREKVAEKKQEVK